MYARPAQIIGSATCDIAASQVIHMGKMKSDSGLAGPNLIFANIEEVNSLKGVIFVEKGDTMIPHFANKPSSRHREVVHIPCGNVTLEGDLEIPSKAPGLVLFAHGSGSSRHSPRNQFVARVIHESGIGTLLFDLLTVEEEAEDNVTSRLRFDIALLADRLVKVTYWTARRMPQYRSG
jgi:hypothetical protein